MDLNNCVTGSAQCELLVILRLCRYLNKDPFFVSSSSLCLVEPALSVPLKTLRDLNRNLNATSHTFTCLQCTAAKHSWKKLPTAVNAIWLRNGRQCGCAGDWADEKSWVQECFLAITSTKAVNVTSWGCDVEWDAFSVARHTNRISTYNYINVRAKR